MKMKSFKLATIQAIRVLVKDMLSKPGVVSTTQAMRILDNQTFGISRSTLRNIFSMIMNDMVVAGRANKMHRGTWEITYENNPIDVEIGSGGKINATQSIPKYVRESHHTAVTFNPQLTAFLDPPKCTKHIEVYSKLKEMKIEDKSRFCEIAIKLCYEVGIPVTRLINYINETRQTRHIEGTGA